MADKSKAEKLALARKKLKEFQQKNKDPPSYFKQSNKKNTTRSTGAPTKEQSIVFDSGPEIYSQASTDIVLNSQSSSSVKSSTSLTSLNGDAETVGEANITGFNHDFPIMVSDDNQSENFIHKDNAQINTQGLDMPIFPQFTMMHNQFPQSDNAISTHSNFSNSAKSVSDFFDEVHSTALQVPPPPQHISDPVNSTHSQYFSLGQTENNVNSNQNIENHTLMSENVNQSVLVFPDNSSNLITDNRLHNEEVSSSNINLPATVIDNVTIPNKTNEENIATVSRSSMESLRQLSMQLNGLIDESSPDYNIKGSTDLEKRNQELAALLSLECQKNEQLNLQIKEHEAQMIQMQRNIEQLQLESETRLTREVRSLQEKLQNHAQTVGILVGEKTELQASLSKSQQVAKQKAAEVEELESRLKSSKQKVSELEKNLSIINENINRLENSNKKLQMDVSKLESEKKSIKERLDETDYFCNEMREKLSLKEGLISTLRQEIESKKSQLEFAELRLQQLNAPDNSDLNNQLINFHEQNVSLEKKVAELQQTLKSVTAERDQASQQYQHYVQQLNSKLESIATECENLTSENRNLVSREQSLVHHISDLEKQIHNQKKADPIQRTQDIQALQDMESKLNSVAQERDKLSESLEAKIQDIEVMEQKLAEQNFRIEELEALLERLQNDQPDRNKLLAAMESDKIAASRAVGQNQKLKEQLEELQDGFIKMSNNKLELTEKLDHEQHVNKDLCEKLSQQEADLNMIREKLQERESTIEMLQEMLREKNSQVVHHEHTEDRARHFEAQAHHIDMLRQELKDAKTLIDTLQSENERLQDSSHQHESKTIYSSEESDNTNLSLLKEETHHNGDEVCENDDTRTANGMSMTPSSENEIKQYESMQEAMEKLQEKFTKTMKEVADLSDEKQRLEHLVLQLQSETETIGEYVTLYQVQRSILRQRAIEKDEQMAKLAKDREELKGKLNNLNELVQHLLKEKGATHVNLTSEVPIGLMNGETTDEKNNTHTSKKLPEDTVLPVVEKALPSENTSTEEINTANKIMALLSEIKTSNLMEPQNNENFHPCPWCSGQLITV